MKMTQRFMFMAVCLPALSWCVDPTAIQQAVNDLNQYQTNQQNTGLQDPIVSYAIQKGRAIADLVIDTNGNLDLAACQQVQPYFIPAQPQVYEQNIQRLLNLFDNSWQNFLSTVVAPADPTGTAQATVRAGLGRSITDTLTDRDARVAVLAALFAPYSERTLAIRMNGGDSDLDAAQDYAELAQKGYFTREFTGLPEYYFYLTSFPNPDLGQVLTIDTSGTIVGTPYTLLDPPGIKAAVHAMGGDLVPNLLPKAMEYFASRFSNGTVSIPVSTVIALFGQVILENNPPGPPAVAIGQLGLYAFNSQTWQNLAAASEYAYACMIENQPANSIRAKFNTALSIALAPTWAKLALAQPVGVFRDTFMGYTNATCRWIYNPTIKGTVTNPIGGFQLYRRAMGADTTLNLVTLTPTALSNVFLAAVNNTSYGVANTAGNKNIALIMREVVKTSKVLDALIDNFDPANAQNPNSYLNYASLPHTPMQSLDGSTPYVTFTLSVQ